MKEIYESLEGQGEDKSFKKVKKSKATHLHKCRHDETPQGPCSREKI